MAECKKCLYGIDTCDGINGTSGFICRDCVEADEFDKQLEREKTQTRPPEVCSICRKVTNPMFMCDEDPLDVFYCTEHWPMMACSKGAHGEGCPTAIFAGVEAGDKHGD